MSAEEREVIIAKRFFSGLSAGFAFIRALLAYVRRQD